MDDDLRQRLYDPAGSHRLVLARRPPHPDAVTCVVSDVVWLQVVRLLRWSAATTDAVDVDTGRWWRLAAGCADLLHRLPGLCDELGEPYGPTGPADDPELPGTTRVALATGRLAELLCSPTRWPCAGSPVRSTPSARPPSARSRRPPRGLSRERAEHPRGDLHQQGADRTEARGEQHALRGDPEQDDALTDGADRRDGHRAPGHRRDQGQLPGVQRPGQDDQRPQATMRTTKVAVVRAPATPAPGSSQRHAAYPA